MMAVASFEMLFCPHPVFRCCVVMLLPAHCLAWHQNYENTIQAAIKWNYLLSGFMWKSVHQTHPLPSPTLFPPPPSSAHSPSPSLYPPSRPRMVWSDRAHLPKPYARNECQVHVSHFLPGVPCDTRGVVGGIRWRRKRGRVVAEEQTVLTH